MDRRVYTACSRTNLAPARAWLTVAVAAALSWLAGCKPNTNAYAPPPPPEVTVAHPIMKPVTRYFEYTGVTEPYESVELRARVSGFLQEVNFKPGAEVKTGDLLFVIDPREYEAAASQAEADVESKRAALRLAEITYQRYEEARRSSAAAPQELDQALAARDEAKAQVALAEATLEKARLNVEFTRVRAPIDGRITKNFVDVGNLVGAGGQPTILANLVDSSPLYVSVDCSERDVLEIRRERLAREPNAEPGQSAPGQWRQVDLAVSDSAGFTVHGRIDYVDPALNPTTGTLRVRCRFENEDGALLPGLFARLRLLLDTHDAVLAPDIVLLSDQSGRYALVVDDKNTVQVRRVEVGVLEGGMRVVTKGLSPADSIIVNGLQRARPGMVVKPVPQQSDTAPQAGPGPASAPGPASPPPGSSTAAPAGGGNAPGGRGRDGGGGAK